MVAHASGPGNDHSAVVIAISLSDLSFWCFACDDYITNPKLEAIFRQFHRGKFGNFPSGTLHISDDPVHKITLMTDTSKDNENGADDSVS